MLGRDGRWPELVRGAAGAPCHVLRCREKRWYLVPRHDDSDAIVRESSKRMGEHLGIARRNPTVWLVRQQT